MYGLWIITIIIGVLGGSMLIIGSVMHHDDSWWWYDHVLFTVITVALIVAFTILLLCSIFLPMDAAKEVNALIHEGEALQKLADNREDLDKLYITERVVQYNKQVAAILGSVEAKGNWSCYYFSNYDQLQYIEF